MTKRLIVIGGGAAGFFCAFTAARHHHSLEVIILEKTGKLLSKVKVSGGGRCNVTHALFDITEMSKRYPRGQNFVKKTFHQFFTTHTIAWFEKRGVKLKTEKDGRMFPVTDDAQTIINCLMHEADTNGVQIRTGTEVKSIEQQDEKWLLQTAQGETLTADFVCIASGGNAKSIQFNWIKALGHAIAEPVPSLFTFNLPAHPINALMGVVAECARVKIEGTKLTEEGPVLITHWGLSGPAILRLSAWGALVLAEKAYTFTVHINWCSQHTDQTLKALFTQSRTAAPSKKLSNHNILNIPNRLWQFLLQTSGIGAELRFADVSAKAENALIRNVLDYTVIVTGKTTFKEEFVTAGGIILSEIDAQTMQSKKHPRLYFAGEVMDVDGITGGFNFQHAWTSGWIAGKSIAAS